MKKLTTDIDKRDNSTNSTATDHNSGSLENDLELSRKIQRAMVPQSLPRIHGIEIDTIFFPCGAIGGDLYDIIQISEDLVAFFVFDVSGHGVSSALISSIAKVLFSNNIHATTSPDNVLKRVNRELKQNIAANFFITAFVAFLDLHSNKLTYCNAGHTYPIVFKKKEKQLIALKTPGLFLGVYNNVNFENREIYLFPEDWFFLFTDGIYSLFNSNEMLGRRDIEASIRKQNYTSPSDFLKKYHKLYKKLITTGSQHDDITAIVVEILTQSRRNQIKKDLGFNVNKPIYLQYLSYYEEIDEASAKVLKDMDEMGYSDDSIRKMKLTITELVANAIGHGNKDDHSKKVTLGHFVESGVVTVAIMDEGEGFNYSNIPDPTLPKNLIKDHGRGLYIARNYVDEIHFNKKGNRVLIHKYRFSKDRKKRGTY